MLSQEQRCTPSARDYDTPLDSSIPLAFSCPNISTDDRREERRTFSVHGRGTSTKFIRVGFHWNYPFNAQTRVSLLDETTIFDDILSNLDPIIVIIFYHNFRSFLVGEIGTRGFEGLTREFVGLARYRSR